MPIWGKLMALLSKISHVLKTDLTKDFRSKSKHADTEAYETFIDQLKKRRTVTTLGSRIRYSQTYLIELIQEAVRSCPSAHNSQSTRVVILFSESHHKFWNIVKEMQRTNVPADVFAGIEVKIAQYADAYGTVLFYEDQSVIRQLQKKRPFDAEAFPIWSEQTSGMAQYAVWTALAESDIGGALLHYNPIVDEEIAKHFAIDSNWKLRAQLIFGSIEEKAPSKKHIDYDQQFKVFS